MSKCIGVFGKLFGHKFKKTVGDYVYSTDYCTRCGLYPTKEQQ